MPSASSRAGITTVTRGHVGGGTGASLSRSAQRQNAPLPIARYTDAANAGTVMISRTILSPATPAPPQRPQLLYPETVRQYNALRHQIRHRPFVISAGHIRRQWDLSWR